MLIQTNTNTMFTAWDLILVQNIYLQMEAMEKNVIIFGTDMSSSVHVDNKRKYILILGEGATQGLNHTLTAEAKYLINFTQSGKSFVLSLHYNGSNNVLFVIATIIQIKVNQIISKQKTMHCVQVILQKITINNMKKTEIKGVVRFFFLILILLILAIL